MMSYIDARIIFFPLFINFEDLIYFQISEVPYLNPQTQFIITFTIEVCVVKFVFIVISGLTFEWGMLLRSDISGVIGILSDRLSNYSVEVRVDDG